MDHIFEIQVIVAMFNLPRPTDGTTSIPVDAWSTASAAANTAGPPCNAIASAVTTMDNLRGIPASLNSLKEKAFSCVMTNSDCPSSGATASYFNYFGPALRLDLSSNLASMQNVIISAIANTLQTIANNEPTMNAYFTGFSNNAY